MAKAKGRAGDPPGNRELATVVQAIADTAQTQAAANARISQLLEQQTQKIDRVTDELSQLARQLAGWAGPAVQPQTPAAVAPGAGVDQVNMYEDDPYSEAFPTPNPVAATPLAVPVPNLNRLSTHPTLGIKITAAPVARGLHKPGTPEFRYWNAAAALSGGVEFWEPLLPAGTRWTTYGLPMPATLDAGQALNATYTRRFGLRYYQQTVRNVAVYAAESPDVVWHELGHAVLDAFRPQLFDAASLEVDAFHESFGDMSSILVSLQIDALREKLLREVPGRLNTNSRLSRVAEQLGWGIRQLSPVAVDRDCLRNAANRFFYADPKRLPPTAPASQLASEPHSLSRVFTGAFLDALAHMSDGPRDEVAPGNFLREASTAMGRLLVRGIRLAPVVPNYFREVAAGMLRADQELFAGRYRAALSRGFVQHGILPASGATGLANVAPRGIAAAVAFGGGPERIGAPQPPETPEEDDAARRGAEDAPTLPTRTLVSPLGFPVDVHAAVEADRLAVAFAAGGTLESSTADEDAAAFFEDLIQLGRVEMEPPARGIAQESLPSGERAEGRKTHYLEKTRSGRFVLKRSHFDCGFHRDAGQA
jgi:hypothetical protein